jgi:uncharacterized protein (UPF0332 family)
MEKKYFRTFIFSDTQVRKYIQNAVDDLEIAGNDPYRKVRFNYTYNALIKACIALLAHKQIKVRSVPGHHVMLIKKASALLKDKEIATMGDLMRLKRNMDLYDGGVDITEHESEEFLEFVKDVVRRVECTIGIS